MKKFTLIIFLVLTMAGTAMAADVVLEVTVPDAYVTRMHDAVQGLAELGMMNCTLAGTTPLDSKNCIETHLRNHARKLLLRYERKVASDTVVPIPIQ